MSVSHPLLRELKGHILDLTKFSEITEIRDSNPGLLPICQNLENIFKTGFKVYSGSSFGKIKQEYWIWIHHLYNERDRYKFDSVGDMFSSFRKLEDLLQLPYAISDAIESSLNSKKVFTTVGRGRLLIRTALLKKLLLTLVNRFLEDSNLVLSMYDPSTSILGNEILSEILSSLLHEVNKIDFKLELLNASFLDDTWELGIYKKYEFVPCKEMGITFACIKGRAIVVKVEEGSVAGEENQIEPGDVLDELYGRSLYRCKRGLVSSLAYQFQGLPIYLSVVKGTCINGGIYPPLLSLLEKLNMRKALERKLCLHGKNGDSSSPSRCNGNDNDTSSLCATFNVLYLGYYSVGQEGRLTQIEYAITKAMSCQPEKKKVLLELGETKLNITEQETKETLLTKHFTEISACGRKDSYPKIFAIIVGNTTCTIATEFHCHVLEAVSMEEAKVILCSIGQGFGRTHWAV